MRRHRKYISSIKRKAKHLAQKAQGKQFIHFLHVGKTGGTAVKYAIKEHTDSHTRLVIYLHPHKVKLRDVPNGEKFFFFLRDPISRFVSSFYSRQRQGKPRYFVPWSPDEKIAFEHFSTPNLLALALSSPNTEEKQRAENAMKSIIHVRDFYWNWFECKEYFINRLSDILFIGFQENLSEDFEILKSKLYLPSSIILPSDTTLAHKNPSDLDKTLDDKAIVNLQHWYKEDFKFIDLCTQIIRENPFIRSYTDSK